MTARGHGLRPVREVVAIDLEWCPRGLPDPPERSYVSRQHPAIARMLRSRPGVWALVRSIPSTYQTAIRQGRLAPYRPGGSFDAREIDGVLYMRYVGVPADD